MPRIIVIVLLGIAAYQSTVAQTRPLYRITVLRGAADTLGHIVIRLFPSITPLHVRNFDSIVRAGRYDSTAFHRVIPDFVIQGGDPNSIRGDENTWGSGDPSQPTVNAEFNAISHTRGRVGMARSDDVNSATSQFYICHGNPTFLDSRYTVFGETVSGHNVIDSVALAPRNSSDRPFVKHWMLVAYDGEDSSKDVAPVPIEPVMDAADIAPTNPVSFRWSVGPDTYKSIIALSTDSLFVTDVLLDTVIGTTTSLVAPASKALYYWRVQGDNGGAHSDWSAYSRFTTKLGWPKLLEPPDGTKNAPTDVVLRWERLLGGTAQYRLQVATSRTFSASRMIVDTSGLQSNEFQLNGLTPGTSYFCRIAASSESGDSSGFSRVNSFSTEASTSVESDALARSFRLSPMPVHSTLTVAIAADYTAPIVIDVVDLQGASVAHAVRGTGAALDNGASIDCSHLSPGVYALRCTSGSVVVTQMFVKL